MKITRPSLDENTPYWDTFYKNLKLSVPSQFCAMVAVELPSEAIVIEFGCGNGRDAFYFASRGLKLIAMDLSQQAINMCSERAVKDGFNHASFVQGSLADADDIANQFALAREISKGNAITCYSRFVMHSINDEQQSGFLKALGNEMKSGEKLYLEFRSKEDADLEKTFGNHYRRFVETDAFIKESAANGFSLDYRMTGQGMARYKREDPFVSRLILIRN